MAFDTGIATGGIGYELFKLPIDYIMRVERHTDNTLLKAVTLPNQPSLFEIKRQYPTHVTYTLGQTKEKQRTFIVERGKHTEANILISGHTGIAPRLGHRKDGTTFFGSPEEILQEFEEFLNESQGTDNFVFDAISEKATYVVSVVSFDWHRSVEKSRVAYLWSLTLHAYRKRVANDYRSEFTKIMEGIGDVINAAVGYVAHTAQIIENLRDLVSSNVAAVLDPITRGCRQIEKTFEQARGLIGNDIFELCARVLETITDFLSAMTVVKKFFEDIADGSMFNEGINRLKSAGDALTVTWASAQPSEDEDRATGEARLALEDAHRALEVLQGFRGRSGTSPKTSRRYGLLEDERGVQGLSEYNTPKIVKFGLVESRDLQKAVLRRGEDLGHVAQRTLGDITRWGDIADVNGWINATTRGDGSRATPGDVVWVPLDTSTGIGRRDPLGTDLHLTPTGDISTEELSSGVRNIQQWLLNLTRTRPGEIRLATHLGWEGAIGGVSHERTAALLSSRLKEQVLLDSRIESVDEMTTVVEDDRIKIDLSLLLATSDTIRVSIPI